MPTFSANIDTSTRSNAAVSDHKLPPLGALSPGSMTAVSALAGTTGIDCSLIHGDEWNQMEGNLTENVLKNHIGTVKLNQTFTVYGNLINRVNGTTNDTRVGVHNQTNIAPRNDTFMHTRSELHYQPEHREQKTEDNDIKKELREYAEKHFDYKDYLVEVRNFAFAFSWPLNFEKHLMDASQSIFSMEGRAFEVEMKEITTSLGALATEIKAGKIKAAATHMKAIAGNINAGVALNLDSPFG